MRNSKYLNYLTNDKATDLNRFFIKPIEHAKHSCGYDIFINQFTKSISRNQKLGRNLKMKLTIPYLYNIVHGKEYKDGDSLALTPIQL